MNIKEKDPLPNTEVFFMEDGELIKKNTQELLKNKKVIIFGLPGAYTSICSSKHLPGYANMFQQYKDKGIDHIICISVNDPFVMDAWGKEHNVGKKILMIGDPFLNFTKAIGADVILLIAACLTKEELKNYGKLAEDLGMEVLYEVHTQQDLDKIELSNKIVGINNRNLKTFEVDLEHSVQLANQIPDDCVKVSESGLSDPRIVTGLKEIGFKGFLIGENFMKTENPGEACEAFISQIR